MNPYSEYIVDPKIFAQPFVGCEESFIRTMDACFSKRFGFQRLGIHHISLPPGARTSLPHAESLEEEFVFVVAGHPHVWLDGWVYALHPHCAVGFPAGTGLSHTFINNSAELVELLVVGEQTKKDNLRAFQLNPEERTLGPHSGKPGPVLPHELGQKWPTCIVDCSVLKMSSGWHYPGDSETFAHHARLTDVLGLQALGISFERVMPGHRTSFPHAHKREEEFVFALSGVGTIWLNGFTQELRAGQAAGFLPGTNIAHTMINNTQSPVLYLVVGEANLRDEQAHYPMHPFRRPASLNILRFVTWRMLRRCSMFFLHRSTISGVSTDVRRA